MSGTIKQMLSQDRQEASQFFNNNEREPLKVEQISQEEAEINVQGPRVKKCFSRSDWEVNQPTAASTATVLHDFEIAAAANFLRLQSEGQITSQARSFEEVGEGEGGRAEPEMEGQLWTGEGELLEKEVKTGTPQMHIPVFCFHLIANSTHFARLCKQRGT